MTFFVVVLRGLLRRPLRTGLTLAGISIGIAAVVALVGLLAAVGWFDLPWSRVPGALLWCAFVSAALITLLTLLHLCAGTQRGSEMLSGVVVFPLMMLGGSFFPLESMPTWMAAAGQWTPNGLGVSRLKDLLYGDVSTTALGYAVLGIGIPAVAAFAASRRRLRSFANA